MKPARVILSLFIVLAFLAIFILKRCHEPQSKEAFERHPSHLYFTKHALCRMDCRHISKEDIDDIMNKGIINFNKSNRAATPCATYAIQGYTTHGEELRVIFAQCSDETKVVTCYNLKEDFECNCPGDQNKN